MVFVDDFYLYWHFHVHVSINVHILNTIGKDFEKVARWNTVFNYNQYNGGSERHETFWKGREFEVLLLTPCKKIR